MKFVVFAVAGLVSATAAAAHAQGKVAPAPAPAPQPAASAAPARSCSLVVTQANGAYTETPLAGFDPAVTSAPLPPVTAANAVMVVCDRTTIIPEVTDYRVLTELRLPLSIRAGQRALFLGAAGGKLQVGLPDGQVTPQDTKALEDRLAEMQTAMAKRK
jgi:hypothetical protein